MTSEKVYKRRGETGKSSSSWLPMTPGPLPQCDDLDATKSSPSFGISTPSKSTSLRPISSICDESSVIVPGKGKMTSQKVFKRRGETGKSSSSWLPMTPGPLPQCDDLDATKSSPSFGISTPSKSTSLRPISSICDESSVILPGKNNDIGTEGASLAGSIYDIESATISIVPNPLPQCDDNLDAKSICDESSVIIPGKNNDIGTEGASLAGPIYDIESATISILPNPLPQCDNNLDARSTETLPSFGISTPAKSGSFRPVSFICDESSLILATLRGNKEIGTEGASLVDPSHNQEATTINVVCSNLPQCDDPKAEPAKPSPSFDISNPTSKCKKRKDREQDYDGRSQKRPKKVYWPKVVGQTKRRKAAKVCNESKIKKIPVSAADGKGRPRRTWKLKIEKKIEENALDGKFNMSCCELLPNGKKHEFEIKLPSTPKEQITSGKRTPFPAKTKSAKRSLKFELEDNLEEFADMQNGLDELNYKGNSLQISQKKIPQKSKPQKRISHRCILLAKIRKMKPSFPRTCKKKRIQGLELFQSIKKGKRSNNRKRRSNIYVVPICIQTSLSKHGVEEKREEKHGVQGTSKERHAMEEKREEKHGVEEKREEVHGVEEKREEEIGVEEKMKMISVREMESLSKKFESLVIRDNQSVLVLYKNQDSRLVPHKGKESQRRKVKIHLDEETLKMWNLLMHGQAYEETEENKNYWEQERSIYLGRVKAFNARMHLILGNRGFSPWKGSVLDSVIGVFLTQNVSDHLSSSAYMSLAATFPIKTTSSEERKEELPVHDNNVDEVTDQNSLEVNQRIQDILNLKMKKPDSPGMVFGKKKYAATSKKVDQIDQERKKKEEQEAEEKEKQYWESIRSTYAQFCTQHSDHMNSIDWEAVRCAEVSKVAHAIEGRGQQNVIAQRIQAFLNKLVEMHGSSDLEWLRYAPPYEVKEYLLKVYGLGLKSVECIRLLALQHRAFPVDVNVGRIAVRLGWVPLEPLPESVQLHLLDQYPIIDMVQQYLWPRLCTLDQPTLYELHYQLITFGKVFCTKKQPNCNACPMRGECKHFASAFASAKLALPGPTNARPAYNSIVRSEATAKSFENFTDAISISELSNISTSDAKEYEPIIEMPASPNPEYTECEANDIEDLYKNDDDTEEMMTVKPNVEEPMKTTYNYFDHDEVNMSKALVALTADAKSIPMPKLKRASRLKTERLVYVLPDMHPLLVGLKMREADDPSPYLLVIWTPGELKCSCELTKNKCNDSTNHCLSCNDIEEENNQTVPGTLLIPCRTAMNGRFPLNGTYFQVNEVFADDDSSKNPINVPRHWIWNLQTQIAYFGTSASTILRGLSLEEIHNCFWRGFVCVRGFDRKTGAPRPLSYRFHLNTTSKQVKKKAQT